MSSAPAAPISAPPLPAIKPRNRFSLIVGALAGIALAWGCLHTPLGPPRSRALVLLGGDVSMIYLLLAAIALVATAWIGRAVAGADVRSGLFSLSAALAVWPLIFGTVDDWLALQNPVPGQGVAGPYWKLLPDYLVLAALVTLTWWLLGRSGVAPSADPATPRSATSPVQGVIALLTTSLVAGIVLLIAFGPRAAPTAIGQVYFSVAVAFVIGVMAGRSVAPAGFAWYLAAPFIVGCVGVVGAALGPVLPAPYALLNIVPVWGLVRPLPIEMIGIGLLAILWTAPHAPLSNLHAAKK